MKRNADQSEMVSAVQEMVNEYLQELNSYLLELERGTGPKNRSRLLDGALRCCHTLKGSAALVRLQQVVLLIQDVEGFLLKMEEGKIGETPRHFNLLFDAIDTIYSVVNGRSKTGEHSESGFNAVHQRLRNGLAEPENGKKTAGSDR